MKTRLVLIVVLLMVPNNLANAGASYMLTAFWADPIADGVEVGWETATETQVVSFRLQRQVDGGGWEQVGEVPATGDLMGGTYSYQDQPLDPGNYGYRLEVVAADGTSSIEDPIAPVPVGTSENTAVYDVALRQVDECQLAISWRAVENSNTAGFGVIRLEPDRKRLGYIKANGSGQYEALDESCDGRPRRYAVNVWERVEGKEKMVAREVVEGTLFSRNPPDEPPVLAREFVCSWSNGEATISWNPGNVGGVIGYGAFLGETRLGGFNRFGRDHYSVSGTAPEDDTCTLKIWGEGDVLLGELETWVDKDLSGCRGWWDEGYGESTQELVFVPGPGFQSGLVCSQDQMLQVASLGNDVGHHMGWCARCVGP